MLCCGDILPVKNNQLVHFLQVKSTVFLEKYSFGTNYPHNDVDFLKKFFHQVFCCFKCHMKRPPWSVRVLRLKLNLYSKFWKFKKRISYNYRHTLFSNTRTTNLLNPVKFCQLNNSVWNFKWQFSTIGWGN